LIFNKFYRTGRVYRRGAVVKFILIDIDLFRFSVLIKLSQLALSDGLAGENSPKIITNGKRPTYGDLVRQYIALNKAARFKKIPHGRYINFVAEFCALEKGATHREASPLGLP